MITIFTPTYNRAHLLSRLYHSLCGQKGNFNANFNFDSDGPLCLPHGGEDGISTLGFEWLIVDDGSTDKTEEIVKGFIGEGKIPIRYYKKQNGGKHTAINMGVELAKGELFFILDSDDYLPSDALLIVAKEYTKVKNDVAIGGITGLDRFADGRIVGSGLPCDTIDCNAIDIRYKYHVTGDMKEVFRTEVLKEFPFPEIEGERFCPEDLVWNRIAKKYKLHFVNKCIYVAEYQDNGLTDNIIRIRHLSPIASMTYYSELFHFDSDGPLYLPHKEEYFKLPFGQKIKAAINYWRFTPLRYYGKLKNMHMMNMVSLCALPLGILMRLNDKRNI